MPMPEPVTAALKNTMDRTRPLHKAFHAYARWLVSISWKRFFLLAVLLYICASILSGLAPFRWELGGASEPHTPSPRKTPSRQVTVAPTVTVESKDGVHISIDENGVRVQQRSAIPAQDAAGASSPAPQASAAAGVRHAASQASGPEPTPAPASPPSDASSEDAADEVPSEEVAPAPRHDREPFRLGDMLMDMTHLFVFASIILKLVYKGQMQAEQAASQASAQAEAEQLRRQLAEARVATIQAQIEPHFLFNTLASIEHLIQSDPPRARRMQQHLIALLRASMPDLREAVERPLRPLARELDMVRPYLEIQKIRMEERLEVQLDIPDGLLSAEFPPLMLQTLVENAICHGLEPQPSGGTLEVRAEVSDGQLIVHVIDNGAGLHAIHAATGPQKGTGLDNVRERLRLHYGVLAGLDLQNRPGGGTHARLHLPYRVASLSHESVRT